MLVIAAVVRLGGETSMAVFPTSNIMLNGILWVATSGCRSEVRQQSLTISPTQRVHTGGTGLGEHRAGRLQSGSSVRLPWFERHSLFDARRPDCVAGHMTPTAESVREPPNWICMTISPEVGASPAAETFAYELRGASGPAFTNRVPGDGDSRPSDLTEVAGRTCRAPHVAASLTSTAGAQS